METTLNMGAFKALDQQKMMGVNGGSSNLWDYVVGYLVGKAIDWVIDNRHEIWQSICDGPSKDDPMFDTPYVRIFSR